MTRTAPCLALLLLLLAASAADARVTRIEILRTEPLAAGQAFGTVGAYEKLVGRFHGELDPSDPLNTYVAGEVENPASPSGFSTVLYRYRGGTLSTITNRVAPQSASPTPPVWVRPVRQPAAILRG